MRMVLFLSRRTKASMTVYLMLSMLLILSIVFTLLESLRIYGTVYLSKQNSVGVAESVFAGYDKDLYDKYHLYSYCAYSKDGLDFTPVYDAAKLVAESATQPENDGKSFWLRQSLADSDVTGYRLVTDDGGMGMYEQMAQCATQEALKDVVDGLGNLNNSVDQNFDSAFTQIEDNANRIYTAEPQATLAIEYKGASKGASLPQFRGDLPATTNPATVIERAEYDNAVNIVGGYGGNPVDMMGSLKSHGILDLVIENTAAISEKTLSKDDLLSNRKIQTGNWQYQTKNAFNVLNKGLVVRYVDKYFNSYVDNGAWGALDYEKEYLIFAKKSDEENLRAAVKRILMIREGCNFISAQKDAVKDAEALELATAICTICLVPEMAPSVKEGILLAWAYGESILDLRTLLTGGKVSIIKNPAEWTLSLENLGMVESGYLKAKNCPEGFSYEAYLNSLLSLESAKKQITNVLDLMEANMRTIKGKEAFSMDMEVLSMECQFTYRSSPLFLSFVKEIEGKPETYGYIRTTKYSYLNDS